MDTTSIEQLAHLSLPPSVAEVHTHVEHGQDSAIWLRFTAAEAEISPMLRAAGYPESLPASGPRFLHDFQLAATPWWRPDALTTARSATIERAEGKRRWGSQVVIGEPEDGRVTVYAFVTQL